MGTLLSVALLAAAVYLVSAAAMYLLQGTLIFHPQPPGAPPASAAVEPVDIPRGGVTLRGWVVNPGESGAVAVYFGGNAEEMSRLVGTFSRLPATTVLVNYRGYGRSEGSPSARALLEDAEAVARWTQRRFSRDRPLVLIGRSLGAGLAVHSASAAGADAVVLLSPYVSLTDLAQRFAPWLPVDLLLRQRIDIRSALNELPARTLVLYATDDLIIPPEVSQQVAEHMTPAPEIVAFAGGHNLPLGNPRLFRPIASFITGTRAEPEAHQDSPQRAPVSPR